MSEKSIKFGEKKTTKVTSIKKPRKLLKIVDKDVDKILISKKESYDIKKSYKYVIWV